jgi:hypothetical protein
MGMSPGTPPKANALVKDLRLAQVSTLEAANIFLEKHYWPEWNERFARPIADYPNQHRALTPALELAAILCHVEQRVIGNDYTFSFAGRRHQIARDHAQAGMRHQRLRVELRLNGELKARYQNRYTIGLVIRFSPSALTPVELQRWLRADCAPAHPIDIHYLMEMDPTLPDFRRHSE